MPSETVLVPQPSALAVAGTWGAVVVDAALAEAVPGETAPAVPGLAAQVLPHWLLSATADPLHAAALAATAGSAEWLLLPLGLPDQSAVGVLPSGNGANAPADNPEDADTLPARALRPDLPRRGDEATVGEAATVAAAAASSRASGPGEASRGTPGMSQPGSVIAASPHPPDRLRINRSYVRLYFSAPTFLEQLSDCAADPIVHVDTVGWFGGRRNGDLDFQRRWSARS